MKILLLGASGLLGNACANAASRRGHDVIGQYYSRIPTAANLTESIEMDLSTADSLTARVLETWPDVIINCAALSSPDQVDAQPQLAERINVALPRLLAQLSTHLGARLIHISTDMVFDGFSEIPYRSTDMPTPLNLYGQTKLMAEREVLEHNSEDPVVLRLPILMGHSPSGKRSVHEKLLAQTRSDEPIPLFCDELRQPCSAENAAELIVELSERRDLHGIFHWAGTEVLSRFEMGQRILRHFDQPTDGIRSVLLEESDNSSSRPKHLAFNLHPLFSKVKTKPMNFQEQLEELTMQRPING